MINQVHCPPKYRCEFPSLNRWHKLLMLCRSGVKHVMGISRKYVQMIMPNFLMPSGLVVLSCGHAIASVAALQRNCDPPRHRENLSTNFIRKLVQILKMPSRHHEHMTLVVPPSMRCNERHDRIIPIYNVLLLREYIVALFTCRNGTEGAAIITWGVFHFEGTSSCAYLKSQSFSERKLLPAWPSHPSALECGQHGILGAAQPC
jgi:hypothetical protein